VGQRNNYAGLDAYAVARVRGAASRLVRTAGFSESDRDDLEQELVLDLLERLPKFDPERATLPTFVARVIAHRVSALVGARCTAHRDGRLNVLSLQDEIDDGEGAGVERWTEIAEGDDRRRSETEGRDADVDLRLDLAAALAALPPGLRALCVRLSRRSITEVARGHGVPRTTLYERITEIRVRLASAGLSPERAPRRRFAGRTGMYQGETSISRDGRSA